MPQFFIFLGLLFISIGISCNSNSKPLKPSIATPKIAIPSQLYPLDTFALVQHWKNIPKQFLQIDSVEAWQLVEATMLDSSFFEIDRLKLEQVEMNQEGEEEVFVTVNDSRVELYQRDNSQQWQLIWEGYDEEGGIPELSKTPKKWVKSYQFISCSECAYNYTTYSRLIGKEVRDIIHTYTMHSYDYESTQSNIMFYDGCDGKFEWKGQQLTAVFELEFGVFGFDVFGAENKIDVLLLQDTITVAYEWEETLDSLLVKEVHPVALKPFFMHCKSLEKSHASKYESGHHANSIVFLAYWSYQKEQLLELKNRTAYGAMIKAVEQEFNCSWNNLIDSWIRDYASLKINFDIPYNNPHQLLPISLYPQNLD